MSELDILRRQDPEVFAAIRAEEERQRDEEFVDSPSDRARMPITFSGPTPDSRI